MNTFETLVTGNTLWQSRDEGRSGHFAEDAIDWGLTGPCLRGSGVDLDLRRDKSVHGYEHIRLQHPDRTDGDVWARFSVAMRECYESHKIVDRLWKDCDRVRSRLTLRRSCFRIAIDMRKHMDSLITTS
jgi:NADH-quinone oxidoreductase subunit D